MTLIGKIMWTSLITGVLLWLFALIAYIVHSDDDNYVTEWFGAIAFLLTCIPVIYLVGYIIFAIYRKIWA